MPVSTPATSRWPSASPITDAMTAADLHDALAPLGADLMVRAMGALERGGLQLTKQSEDGVTYAAKIDKAEAQIDWTKPARDGAATYSRPVAVSRRVVRVADRRRRGADQDFALRTRRAAAARRATCSMMHLTIACGDGAIRVHGIAARRQAADEGGGFSARHGDRCKPPARVAVSDAALQTHHRI